jgi:hypothetical protein
MRPGSRASERGHAKPRCAPGARNGHGARWDVHPVHVSAKEGTQPAAHAHHARNLERDGR